MKRSIDSIMYIPFRSFFGILLGMVIGFASHSAMSADYLIAISHKNDINKKVTVYEPQGTEVFSYVPEGSFSENTPRFIRPVPSAKRFFVSCPNGDAQTGGIVEAFDYSRYPESIAHVMSIETGDRPFHIYVTPDDLVCVANDGENTFSLIHPETLEVETLAGGYHHATIGFAEYPGTSRFYDIYATQFHPGEPGGVDIIDGNTRQIRKTLLDLLPLPHSVVYSSLTKRIYIACAGGVEVFGTEGEQKDQHLKTIPTTEGHMTPSLKISPDGRYIVGNCHWDGEPGSYFYSVDLLTEEMTTCQSVSCKGYAYSPDGKWIVAGDFNKPGEEEIQRVHVISTDPSSTDYMTVVKEFRLSTPSQVGFLAQDFSPDGQKAYLGLTQTDQVMVVDVKTLTADYFDCDPAPFFLSVIPLHVTSCVESWRQLR